MKKFNEFSISAFVATVPEVKEFEKSSVARFCLSVSHVENKGDEKVSKTALLPVEKWVSNDKKDELNDLKGKARHMGRGWQEAQQDHLRCHKTGNSNYER